MNYRALCTAFDALDYAIEAKGYSRRPRPDFQHETYPMAKAMTSDTTAEFKSQKFETFKELIETEENLDVVLRSTMRVMSGEQVVEQGAPAFIGKLDAAIHIPPRVPKMTFPAAEQRKVLEDLTLMTAEISYMV